MDIDKEISRYFGLAKELGHNPHHAECLHRFLRIWQGGKLCKRHKHHFKRTHINKCVDCQNEEITIYAGLIQLRWDEKIHTVIEDGKILWRIGKKPAPVKKCRDSWSSGMEKVLCELLQDPNNSAKKIADHMNEKWIFGRTVTRNAVIGKIYKMKKDGKIK